MCLAECIDVSLCLGFILHVCVCVSLFVYVCVFFFFYLCVPSHTHTLPCACVNTIKASHPAALLNYTPRLLKRLPQNPASVSPKVNTSFSLWHLPEGEDYNGAYEPGTLLYIIALTRKKKERKKVLLCGLVFSQRPRILPIQNTIPGTKWVCCVYGFERCHGIF